MSRVMDYVHGYTARERIRLSDQAILAGRSPAAEFTSVDVSARSVAEAERRVKLAGCKNVRLLRGDVYRPPFEPASFDHVFVCFVLEHLRDPA